MRALPEKPYSVWAKTNAPSWKTRTVRIVVEPTGRDASSDFRPVETVGHAEVVLGVVARVDDGERRGVARLEAFQQVDDLLLVVGHRGFLHERGAGAGGECETQRCRCGAQGAWNERHGQVLEVERSVDSSVHVGRYVG